MSFAEIMYEIVAAVARYLRYDWWILALGITIAVTSKVYFSDSIARWAQGKSGASLVGAVGAGAFTPLCACGTMAVILSMFISSLPWGAVMAFLVTSPLASPDKFVLQSGFLGTGLATAGLVSALALGLAVGLLSDWLSKHTSFFANQHRLAPSGPACSSGQSCCTSCGDGSAGRQGWFKRWKLDQVLSQIYYLGIRRVLLFFILFIALGQMVQMFVPADTILLLFDPGKFYSIPLAAVIGLPLYISGAAGLPLLETFLNNGAGPGAVLAFLIAGQGTSIGVITGISIMLKKRALAFYAVSIFTGAVLCGTFYQLLLNLL